MPRTIRVATYNLYLGADVTVVFRVTSPAELTRQARAVLDQLRSTDFPARAEAVAAMIVREGLDLVGLQEVAQWSRTVPGEEGPPRTEVWLDFLTELLDALARAGGEYDPHALTANFRGGADVDGRESMAVLGHNVILVRRGSGVRVTGEATGDFERTLAVATGMPDLVLDIARSWGRVDVEAAGRPLRFVNTHLEAWDDDVRNAQRDELLAAVGDTGAPVVVVGDFNATPNLVGMPPEFADAWAVAGRGGDGLTCGQTPDLAAEQSDLRARIDYVWARAVAVTNCRVVGGAPEDRTASGLWPSDHAAVVADISL